MLKDTIIQFFHVYFAGFFLKEEIHDAHISVCVGIFTKIFYPIVLEIKKKVYEFCVYQFSINALSQDGEYIQITMIIIVQYYLTFS